MSDEKDAKELLEEQNKTFEAFKEANDEMQTQIKKLGSVDTVLVEKVEKIGKALDAFEDENQKLVKAIKERKAAEDKAREDSEAAAKAAEEAGKAAEEEAGALKGRVDLLETALKRAPKGGTEEEEKAEEALDLFLKYCRVGKEELSREEVAVLDEVKSLSLGDDTAAGYLATPEMVREIIKGEIEFSPIRSIARVRTTGKRSVQIPRRTGQFSAVWVAEQGTRSETTGLTYGLEDIPTHEMSALVDVSEQMLEDSDFNLEQELQQEFTEQFGVAEGTAFVTGDGSGKPEGFLDNTDVASTNSGSASTIADTDGQANGIIDLYHAIKTAYARNATWVLNRTTLGSVRKLKDNQKNYIWQPGLASLRPNTILDAPYIEATDMPDEASNAFPIAFGDFRRGYTIVDRVQLSVLRDPFTQAGSGNVRFIARRRVAGQVVLPESIRLLKCAA